MEDKNKQEENAELVAELSKAVEPAQDDKIKEEPKLNYNNIFNVVGSPGLFEIIHFQEKSKHATFRKIEDPESRHVIHMNNKVQLICLGRIGIHCKVDMQDVVLDMDKLQKLMEDRQVECPKSVYSNRKDVPFFIKDHMPMLSVKEEKDYIVLQKMLKYCDQLKQYKK